MGGVAAETELARIVAEAVRKREAKNLRKRKSREASKAELEAATERAKKHTWFKTSIKKHTSWRG